MAGRLQLVADSVQQRFFGRIFSDNMWETTRDDGTTSLPSLEHHGAERVTRKWIAIAEVLGKMSAEVLEVFMTTELAGRLREAFEAEMGLIANG